MTSLTTTIGTTKLAIVGMDSWWGTCDGLDAFERSIYDGDFQSGSPQTWGARGAQSQTRQQIGNFDPSQLTLQVADRALQDFGSATGRRLGIIMIGPTELPVQALQQKWPKSAVSLKSVANSLFDALKAAEQILAAGEADAVLIGAVNLLEDLADLTNVGLESQPDIHTLSYDLNAKDQVPGEGAGAVVLKRLETAQQAGDRIYAIIDAVSQVQQASDTQSPNLLVQQACQLAFQQADVKPANVGYLEVTASGQPDQDQAEIQGLITAYQTVESELSCAIGSAKVNIGQTGLELAGLIKAALCLYHRFIPAIPQWSGPKQPELWQDSPFYVPTESRPWFLNQGATQRVAAINSLTFNGSYTHIILSEDSSQPDRQSRYLEQMPFYLFPIAADRQSALLEQLVGLEQAITDSDSLAETASQTFKMFQTQAEATYALAILGRNKDELKREIQRAFKGINTAFETGKDWQTPVGSYLTVNPLGRTSAIAFVYPGAFGAYVGVGRNLFKLFPKVYDDPVIKSVTNRLTSIEKLLYPRSRHKLSNRESERLEQKLLDDLPVMFESEVGIASLLTAVMRDYFQIQPQAALGYSLGEISMMYAQGVWNNFSQGSSALLSSPLFEERLSGPKYAVREFWGASAELLEQDFWSSYILIAPASQVIDCLKNQQRVYLTQINSPKEVVIAGHTQACQTVIETLACDAIQAPFKHVIHCEAMRSEHSELAKLNTLPIQNLPKVKLYSAANCQPISLDSQSIGNSIANTLCQQFDFPRLLQQAYQDGYKIFVEVGAGGICSRWINETLNSQDQVTISLNKRGVDDFASILKALAKLLSHRVSLDLSVLYGQNQSGFNQNREFSAALALDQKRIIPDGSTITNDKNIANQTLAEQTQAAMNGHENKPNSNSQNGRKVRLQNNHAIGAKMNHRSYSKIKSPLLLGYQHQVPTENFSAIAKNHSVLLQYRHNSLQQISEMIKMQITLSEQFLTDQTLTNQSPLNHHSSNHSTTRK
ncbi:MAG: type I polyketide synthase [Aphanocapsa sp. GSE-SYN-MK-11-07L]|jgi:PfaB family protein|nr:type I polyketide synthase [Aphanocapsa sp. GSE-SYN-MK-11-07L]